MWPAANLRQIFSRLTRAFWGVSQKFQSLFNAWKFLRQTQLGSSRPNAYDFGLLLLVQVAYSSGGRAGESNNPRFMSSEFDLILLEPLGPWDSNPWKVAYANLRQISNRPVRVEYSISAWEIASCMYKIIPRAQLVIIKTAIFWNQAEFSHSVNRHAR